MAARLLVRASRAAAPPLAELVRLVHGLHLTLAVTVEAAQQQPTPALRQYAETWQVDVLRPDQVHGFAPGRPCGLGGRRVLAYLELSITAVVPTNPDQPGPADPGAAVSAVGDPARRRPDGGGPSARASSSRAAGRGAAHPTGCHVHLRQPEREG
ncbi:hypothetical protein OG792_00335 [Micromonospora sp. NBC_01699]|uniref:hypothetical protein n=1 Tax=Micromonospora sp. NBC_01699 TaxID=2975984 RepID=UPI002E28BCFF|nr:hypothetical protein [Micromonospora sp. NBC_01699]